MKRTIPFLLCLFAFTAFAAGIGPATLGKVEAKLKLAFASQPKLLVVIQYQSDDKDARGIARQIAGSFKTAGFTAVEVQKMENDTAPKLAVTIDNVQDGGLRDAARLLLSAVAGDGGKLFLEDNPTYRPTIYVRVGPQ